MTCILLFAKTAARFTDEEIERFKKVAGQKVPLILFTAKELEPYEVYQGEDWDRLPHKACNGPSRGCGEFGLSLPAVDGHIFGTSSRLICL